MWNQIYLAAIACGFLCASVQAVTYSSVGSANPTAFGAVLGFEATQSPLPMTSSGNDGEAYWRIHQEALAGDFGRANYVKSLAAGDTSDSGGWTLTYRA